MTARKSFPRSRAKAPVIIDPVKNAMAEIDREIERLDTLAKQKRRYIDRNAGNIEKRDEETFSRTFREVDEINKRIGSARARRWDVELNGLPPEKVDPASANKASPARSWEIKEVAQPKHPARTASAEALDAAWNGYIDHAVATFKKNFRKAGISPDSSLRAEFLAISLGSINGVLKWQRDRAVELQDQISALQQRVVDLEAAPIRYRGVWQRSDEYKRGHVVTDSGSAWHAVKDVPPGEKPGASDAWQLMVKAGKDGKDKT